jgi:hypothetical protein
VEQHPEPSYRCRQCVEAPLAGEGIRRARPALAISDDNVLATRTFRNHFEHFDERLEAWAAADPSRNFVDSNIGPPGMIAGIDPAGFLRNLDTKGWALTFRGDAYQLLPIAAALQDLHARAVQLKDAR